MQTSYRRGGSAFHSLSADADRTALRSPPRLHRRWAIVGGCAMIAMRVSRLSRGALEYPKRKRVFMPICH